METDIRLVAKIYRAIREFPNGSPIDESKCDEIARLIDSSDLPVQIEAMVEQHADRIRTMRAEDFVAFLRDLIRQEQAVSV